MNGPFIGLGADWKYQGPAIRWGCDMSGGNVDLPEFVPMLSRGKHRSPRKGACFMELVSYLAGERWSDHPACTHPLLAALARLVNDHTSDVARSRLGGLIPSVIGLAGDDLHVDARIVLRSATTALPVAAAQRQQALALSVLATERVLADLDGRPADWMGERSRWALAQVPHAARWASELAPDVRLSPKRFRRHAAPATVRCAVEGIAQACVPDPDAILHDLLAGAVDDCAALLRGAVDPGPRLDEHSWAAACRLTGTAAGR